MMFKHYFNIYFILISIIITACSGSRNISNTNYAYLYKQTKELNPDFIVYHVNPTTSRIYFRVPKNDIEFKKVTVDDEAIARLRLSTKLYSSYNNEFPVDTASSYYTKSENEIIDFNGIEYIIDSLDIKVQMGFNYTLLLMFTDLNQSKFYNYTINIEKSSINNRQQFRITDENEMLLFNYYFNRDDIVYLEHHKNPTTLFVRYYKRDFPLAAPAFANTTYQPFNYNADSTFTINAVQNKFQLVLKKEGFYHLQVDSLNDKEGITFFVFGNNFPNVSSPENLLEPLRFITSREEYEEIKMAENIKLQVERFWLNAGGSYERARELIKKYYSRVYHANILFSSYKEGWKTDRGMIFLIFGMPNIVNKTSSYEIWIYGEENNMMSLNFTFYKVTNPFTDNDYILDRSIIYKNNWYRAVESWRQGRIY